MLNEKVKHIILGQGTIIYFNEEKKITVHFDNYEENKIFRYPEAFEKFLKFIDPVMEKKALEDLEKKNEEKRIEKEKVRAEFEKKFEEELKEKIIQDKDLRRQSRRKSVKKK